MQLQQNVSFLVDEYRALLKGLDVGAVELLEEALVRKGEWTPRAAEHMIQLAKNYGSFMLRNALAVSLALGIEDGDIGF
jgi:hypothetical protein